MWLLLFIIMAFPTSLPLHFPNPTLHHLSFPILPTAIVSTALLPSFTGLYPSLFVTHY